MVFNTGAALLDAIWSMVAETADIIRLRSRGEDNCCFTVRNGKTILGKYRGYFRR